MENKWMTICETLPPIGMDVLFQNDNWISSFNTKGVRIGYFNRGGFKIITAANSDDFNDYITNIIDILKSDAAYDIKWKLIE